MIIVDAANVIGSRPDGWWRDRAGATATFVDRVRGAGLADVVVVVEGRARAGVAPARDVVHAAGSGDDAIVALVSAGDVVVTADRALRQRVSALGASAVGPGWLYERI
jgi:uncharacterized protein YaiI (UPF0178 family)